MKAFLIDPTALLSLVLRDGKDYVAGLVREVEFDGNYQTIYTHLTYPAVDGIVAGRDVDNFRRCLPRR